MQIEVSKYELAKLLKLNPYTLDKYFTLGVITQNTLGKIKTEISQYEASLWSEGDVMRIFCLTAFAVDQLKAILPPPVQIGKRKFWKARQRTTIKRAIAKLATLPRIQQDCQPWSSKGLFSVVQAAEYLGCPLITFRSWLDTSKKIPKPTHRFGIYKYNLYTKAELDGFRANELAYYFAKKKKKK